MGRKKQSEPVYEPGQVYEREQVDPETGETVLVPMRRGAKGGWLTVNQPGSKAVRHKMTRQRKIPELEILLAEILSEENENGISAAKLIFAALRKKAVAGDVRAAELLMDRAWGKAKQEINVNKTERQLIVIAGQKIEF